MRRAVAGAIFLVMSFLVAAHGETRTAWSPSGAGDFPDSAAFTHSIRDRATRFRATDIQLAQGNKWFRQQQMFRQPNNVRRQQETRPRHQMQRPPQLQRQRSQPHQAQQRRQRQQQLRIQKEQRARLSKFRMIQRNLTKSSGRKKPSLRKGTRDALAKAREKIKETSRHYVKDTRGSVSTKHSTLDISKSLQKLKNKIAASSVKYGAKIIKQMPQRGWSKGSIKKTIANPHRTNAVRDTRHKPDGSRMNDPATAYINKDGSYVVRNNKNGDIVQISDKNDPNWKSPF